MFGRGWEQAGASWTTPPQQPKIPEVSAPSAERSLGGKNVPVSHSVTALGCPPGAGHPSGNTGMGEDPSNIPSEAAFPELPRKRRECQAAVFLPGVLAGMAFSCPAGTFPTPSCCCCSSPNLPRMGKAVSHPALHPSASGIAAPGSPGTQGFIPRIPSSSRGSGGWEKGTQPQPQGERVLGSVG